MFYSNLLLHRSVKDTRCIDSIIREWEIHIKGLVGSSLYWVRQLPFTYKVYLLYAALARRAVFFSSTGGAALTSPRVRGRVGGSRSLGVSRSLEGEHFERVDDGSRALPVRRWRAALR